MLACFSSSGRQWTIIAVSANRYQSVRASWRPAPLPCCLSGRRHFQVEPLFVDRVLSSVDMRSLARDASASLPPVDRGKPRRRPFPLRHQDIESSPHSPCWDRTVTTGDERNQLCSRWRRSTKGEPSYDLGRMAAPDTRRPIGGHRRESSFTAASVAATRPPALEIAAVGSLQGDLSTIKVPANSNELKRSLRSTQSRMLSAALPAYASILPPALDEILSVCVANEGGVHARRKNIPAFGNDEGVAIATMVIVIFSCSLSIAGRSLTLDRNP